MPSKYLLLDLDDEKAKHLADVLANETCKKILNILAEKEASASTLSENLNLALNTITYNLEKLLNSGLIEKSRHFWSVKGRKIETYKLANKNIVISPKQTIANKLKSIMPLVLISGIFTYFVYFLNKTEIALQKTAEKTEMLAEKAMPAVASYLAENTIREIAQQSILQQASINPALWFGAGSIIMIIAFLIWFWRRL